MIIAMLRLQRATADDPIGLLLGFGGRPGGKGGEFRRAGLWSGRASAPDGPGDLAVNELKCDAGAQMGVELGSLAVSATWLERDIRNRAYATGRRVRRRVCNGLRR